MECLGPQCAAMLLDWLKARAAGSGGAEEAASGAGRPQQGLLWTSAPYVEEAPAIASRAELAGALEHLQYAVYRRYHNQLTRAERARLDNSIDNALFKIDRYLPRLDREESALHEAEVREIREEIREGRERVERQYHQARRADLKIAQLADVGLVTRRLLGIEPEQVAVDLEQGVVDRVVQPRALRPGQLVVIPPEYGIFQVLQGTVELSARGDRRSLFLVRTA